MSPTQNNRIVQPYLFFDGRCEEAIDFYRRALDAELTTLMRFKDSPDPTMCVPGSDNMVMHASFRIGETTVMASDGRCGGQASFQGFALSLSVLTEAEAERLFAALANGGQVQMPLAKTFFSPRTASETTSSITSRPPKPSSASLYFHRQRGKSGGRHDSGGHVARPGRSSGRGRSACDRRH